MKGPRLQLKTQLELEAIMPIALARLRPSNEQIAKITQGYARHRPLIQRGLTAGFVLYVLSTTYNGLFGRARAPSKLSKDKGRAKAEGEVDTKKPPRVAVRVHLVSVHNSEYLRGPAFVRWMRCSTRDCP